MALPPIYFIRHGETDWNAEGRLQGQRDIPLNDVGRVQAEEAGQLLPALVARPEDLAWWASPLSRTRETMERARNAIGLQPTHYRQDVRLKELTFGSWEGLTWKEVKKADPAGAKAREAGKWDFAPPGGESYQMLLERVRPFLSVLDRPSVIVAHGGIARVMLAELAGLSHGRAVKADIWQGRILVFEDGKAGWRPHAPI
jgi:broad specificity phosphatase PhoE